MLVVWAPPGAPLSSQIQGCGLRDPACSLELLTASESEQAQMWISPAVSGRGACTQRNWERRKSMNGAFLVLPTFWDKPLRVRARASMGAPISNSSRDAKFSKLGPFKRLHNRFRYR